MTEKSMHSHLPELSGMTQQNAEEYVKPFGYSLKVIGETDGMDENSFTVSVRLKDGVISKVFAWARPVYKQSDSMNEDSWNFGWLDEKNSEIFHNWLVKQEKNDR